MKRDYDLCEKQLLEAIELSDKLTQGNVENAFLNQYKLCTLYMYSNIELAHDFSDSEIQAIYDAKKDYNQDEGYFTYLDGNP